MTDEKEYKRQVAIARVIHHIVLIGTVALIAFSLWFAYSSSQVQNHKVDKEKQEIQSNIKSNGHAKPLPDFIVDKIPSDKLEQLKP